MFPYLTFAIKEARIAPQKLTLASARLKEIDATQKLASQAARLASF